MDTNSIQNPAGDGSKKNKRRTRKERLKKANKKDELPNMNQMDDNLEVPDIGKICIAVNNDLQSNLIVLDTAAQSQAEQSKMDTRSTENLAEWTEWTVLRKKKKRERNKKKANNEGELQIVDQMDDNLEVPNNGKINSAANNDLQSNLIELDSTAQSQAELSKMDTMSTENLAEGTVQRKKKKKKQNKKKAKNEGEPQIVDQMDDNLEDPDNGKVCAVANNDMQNNLIELDSTAQSHVEPSKMDTRSTENLTEGTVKRKRRRKQNKKKAKNKEELQSVDQMDDNLEVPNNVTSCTVANNDLQNKLIEVDSTAQSHVEQFALDTRSIENLKEGTVQRKKRRKRKKKKAKSKYEIQSADQMDDNLEVPKIGMSCTIANSDLQNNLIELDSIAQPEQSKMDTVSTENLAEGTVRRKKRKRKQNKKGAKNKYELQSADIMSSLNLPDVNGIGNGGKLIKNESTTSLLRLVHDTMSPVGLSKHNETALAPVEVEISSYKSYSEFLEQGSGHLEGPRNMEVEMFSCESQHIPLPNEMSGKNEKIENDFNEEEIIVYLGKDSAACSSCDVEVTKHLSSSILKEEDHLSKDSCLYLEKAPFTFVRRKLLVLDVNGLLADIVMPAPKDCIADTRIWGRAIFRRPFCDDFLKFCFEKFDVAIWSSRSKRIIEKVVNYLLGDLQHKLLFCWDMSQSTQTSFKTLENVHKPLVMKELKKIWEKYDPNLPWEKGYYNESNTLLLDDSPYKALLNPLHTAIFPYSYHYKDKSDNSLGPGGDLRVYLEDVLKCDNVKKYVEQHPFGQGAIDETNAFWSFYSRVLESVSAMSV